MDERERDRDKMDEQITKLYRIRKTVNNMLVKRGYLVDTLQSMSDYRESMYKKVDEGFSLRDANILIVRKQNNHEENLMVFFAETTKTQDIRKCAEMMMEAGRVNRGILIHEGAQLSSKALEAIQEVKIETFRDADLLVDITEHKLVPEHVLLSDNEKALVLSRYKLKENQLPKIYQADPIARYLGLQKNQVVKITRPSETAGRYVTYRVCR